MRKKFRHAMVEYYSHGIFILIVYIIYTQLPYFQNLLGAEGIHFLNFLVLGYFVLGIFYFNLRDFFFWRFYKDSENKSTITLKLLGKAAKKIPRFLKSTPKDRRFMDIQIEEKERVAAMAIFVKFFYIPLMLSFAIGNFHTLQNDWLNPPQGLPIALLLSTWIYFVIYNAIFFLDTFVFLFGYLFEAKWLKNEIKSVDPYPTGWLFALISYPPFNGIVEQFFPSSQGSNSLALPLMLCLQAIIICLYLIYVWSTLALFTKASNLTNRGIVGQGPYRYVRHPAYASKNLAWWLEKAPYITSWFGILSILIWNFIYIMRALTEERHLLRDENYRTYVQIVKYRFIPKVI